MVLDGIGEIIEMFKNSFPLSFLFFVPIFIIISPVSPVNGAHEFSVFRMQQYDLHGLHYALMGAATANGFQMVINGANSKALPDFQISNLQGHLSGYGIEEQLTTVAIVAHYDAFGVAPSLAEGADSNGSGVIALLELARLFSKLFTNSRTHAKYPFNILYNLVFLLAGGGKFNYQGTKRWIEDNIDSSDTNILSDVAYVLCLDTLGSSDDLYLHVSKPPRDDSAGGTFLKNLEDIVKTYFPYVNFKMIHKKINLADELLAWEHERFSIKRLPAFTLSRLETHNTPERYSILDTSNKINAKKLSRNIQIIAESIARHIYNLTKTFDVQEDVVSAWIEQLTAQPRAAQLLGKDHSLLLTLEEVMSRYLKDVKHTTLRADKRDPEFLFYDGASYIMSAYNGFTEILNFNRNVFTAAENLSAYTFDSNRPTVLNEMKKIIFLNFKNKIVVDKKYKQCTQYSYKHF
ncbi:LOW QUALITY PROTEIN: hypothetical protein KUTeg_017445 [Tegillarca granosa]|uniref:BOS complex subunit NCLN n=1 Tax=Tegillarca granosa TaxID=220873 RepID=A0ABQ9EEZ0_TEGGR|nr:LOW QUALITY PROTEIN: hypothetical protein KUTeg_017445 [Tegillarca granosa]